MGGAVQIPGHSSQFPGNLSGEIVHEGTECTYEPHFDPDIMNAKSTRPASGALALVASVWLATIPRELPAASYPVSLATGNNLIANHAAGTTLAPAEYLVLTEFDDVAKKLGWSVKHYEQRIPPGLRHSIGKIGLVVVMVGMVSHALRDQVKELVTDESRVKYVRTASVSALRAAIEEQNG